MSGPVNIATPCDGDAYQPRPLTPSDSDPSCVTCVKRAGTHQLRRVPFGNCTGAHGWPILAYAAAEVARERGEGK